jgi:predicted DNA-binding transcriptional regulator AlpA
VILATRITNTRGSPVNETKHDDPLITRAEFCAQGKFGLKTLRRIEASGEGPPAIEITPGFIRYRQSAVDRWFTDRTRVGARPRQATAAVRKLRVV